MGRREPRQSLHGLGAREERSRHRQTAGPTRRETEDAVEEQIGFKGCEVLVALMVCINVLAKGK